MRKLFLIILMIIASTLVFCQTKADSPQTVEWDATASSVGIITYEVYLVPVDIVDRSNVGAFYFLGTTTLPEKLVDVGIEGLEGDFFVGIRIVRNFDAEITHSGMAYSDVETDVDPIGGTFFLRYLKDLEKPKRIRIR